MCDLGSKQPLKLMIITNTLESFPHAGCYTQFIIIPITHMEKLSSDSWQGGAGIPTQVCLTPLSLLFISLSVSLSLQFISHRQKSVLFFSLLVDTESHNGKTKPQIPARNTELIFDTFHFEFFLSPQPRQLLHFCFKKCFSVDSQSLGPTEKFNIYWRVH